MQIDSMRTSLPAMARCAHQQGQSLTRKPNKIAQAEPELSVNDAKNGDVDSVGNSILKLGSILAVNSTITKTTIILSLATYIHAYRNTSHVCPLVT